MADGGWTDPRVPLAIERTFLAWVRTGLAMMGFGFVVARFGVFLREIQLAHPSAPPAATGGSAYMGTALVALGVVVTLYSVIQFRRDLASVAAGRDVSSRHAAPVVIAVLLAMIGIASVWYFLTAM